MVGSEAREGLSQWRVPCLLPIPPNNLPRGRRSSSLDDEFCLGQSSGCQLATTIASERTAFAKVLKIPRPSTLKALYGNISDLLSAPLATPPRQPGLGVHGTISTFTKDAVGISEGITGPADYYALIPS